MPQAMVCASGLPSLPHSTFSLKVEQGQEDLHACCFGDTSLQLAEALTAVVKTGLNARSAVSTAQVCTAEVHWVAANDRLTLSQATASATALELMHRHSLAQAADSAHDYAGICCGLS